MVIAAGCWLLVAGRDIPTSQWKFAVDSHPVHVLLSEIPDGLGGFFPLPTVVADRLISMGFDSPERLAHRGNPGDLSDENLVTAVSGTSVDRQQRMAIIKYLELPLHAMPHRRAFRVGLPGGPCWSLAGTNLGTQMYAAGCDHLIRLLDINSGQQLKVFSKTSVAPVISMFVCTDRGSLLVGTIDSTVEEVDLDGQRTEGLAPARIQQGELVNTMV